MTTTLPSPLSIWPADRAKLAAVNWRHTHLVACPTCSGPALVGYLDGAPVAYACHKCPAAKRKAASATRAMSD
jgi:hypothetical protein